MQKVKLSEITTYITDGEHGSVHDTKSNFYLLSNKNIVDGRVFISDNERTISENDFSRIMNRIKIRRNSILISTVGQIGKIAIIDSDEINFAFQRSVGIINIDENIANPYYVYLYLQLPSVQKYINFKAKGSIQKCLFIGDIGDLEIYLPSLKEQNRIVKNIIPMEIKAILNNKINSELESLAKTIYDYWFLQFDFPNEEGKPYKSSGGAMEYNEELKMDIPKGWDVKKINELADIYQPQTISNSLMNDSFNYPVYGGGGYIGRYNKYNHEESEVIITCRGSCGEIYQTLPYSWITGNAMVVHPLNDKLTKNYLYQCLKCFGVQNYLTGSVQKQLTRDNLSLMPVLCPNKGILMKFEKIISPITLQMQQIGSENRELVSLRDYLLPLLMNGQVGFKDE